MGKRKANILTTISKIILAGLLVFLACVKSLQPYILGFYIALTINVFGEKLYHKLRKNTEEEYE